jgi:hypothetical protein
MRPSRRRGFVISPRLAFPVLLVVVLLMFLVFASLDRGYASTARIVATAIVAGGILLLFGVLAFFSRVRRPEQDAARSRALPAP